MFSSKIIMEILISDKWTVWSIDRKPSNNTN